MKLEYKSQIEESSFIMTDFKCEPAQQLLKDRDLYKILWARDNASSIVIDGYTVQLEFQQILFSTNLNVLEIPHDTGIIAILFNKEFYCIRDHDHEVSCNGMLFFGSSEPPIMSLSSKEVESFERMFATFKEEFETQDHIQGEMLRVMLKRLLIKSTRLVKESRDIPKLANAHLDMIRKFHILVEEHFREKHKVKDYADLLFKSPKTISNVFKNAGYASPLTIINQRIILEAKRLLLFSDKTAEQIGFELGYNEGGHFSKFFKTNCDLPPGEFREQQLKK